MRQINWNINVDEDTVNLWKELDQKNDSRLTDFLKINTENDKTSFSLKFNDDSSRMCLDDDGMCVVQKEYGHEAIPETCRDYPRFSRANDSFELVSASLSCPEILRLVVMETSQPGAFKASESSEFMLPAPKADDFIANIRFITASFIHKVFRQSRIPANVKFFYIAKLLAIFHFELESNGLSQELVKNLFPNNPGQELQKLTSQYKRKELIPDPVTAGSFWRSVTHMMQSRDNLFTELVFNELPIVRLCEQESEEFEHFKTIYSEILVMQKVYNSKYRVKYQKHLEKYLRVSLVNKGIPLQDEPKNLMQTLVPILVTTAQVHLILWMMASQDFEIDDALFAKVIYQTEARLGHASVIEKTLLDEPHMLQVHRYAEVLLDIFV